MAFDLAGLSPGLLNSFGTIVTWLIGSLILGVVTGIIFYFIRLKRFNWVVRVFEKDASDNIIQLSDDKGGIFLDKKTNYRLLLLKKHKFGLDPDTIPYIMNSKGKRIVYLLKTGLKNYQFLKPSVSEDHGVIFNVQDEDVAWALNAYQKYKIPGKYDMLRQILPIIGIAVFGIVVIAVIYLILDEFAVLSEVASSLSQATENMKYISTGTTIVE